MHNTEGIYLVFTSRCCMAANANVTPAVTIMARRALSFLAADRTAAAVEEKVLRETVVAMRRPAIRKAFEDIMVVLVVVVVTVEKVLEYVANHTQETNPILYVNVGA